MCWAVDGAGGGGGGNVKNGAGCRKAGPPSTVDVLKQSGLRTRCPSASGSAGSAGSAGSSGSSGSQAARLDSDARLQL